MEENNIELSDKSKVALEMDSALVRLQDNLVDEFGNILPSKKKIAQLQLDVIRMQDAVALNEEFRIKWPRGEMGALPDDAKQDLRILYLQEDVNELKKVVKELEIENAKLKK